MNWRISFGIAARINAVKQIKDHCRCRIPLEQYCWIGRFIPSIDVSDTPAGIQLLPLNHPGSSRNELQCGEGSKPDGRQSP